MSVRLSVMAEWFFTPLVCLTPHQVEDTGSWRKLWTHDRYMTIASTRETTRMAMTATCRGWRDGCLKASNVAVSLPTETVIEVTAVNNAVSSLKGLVRTGVAAWTLCSHRWQTLAGVVGRLQCPAATRLVFLSAVQPCYEGLEDRVIFKTFGSLVGYSRGVESTWYRREVSSRELWRVSVVFEAGRSPGDEDTGKLLFVCH